MLKSHEKFFTENGKRLVLIATRDPGERSFFEDVLGDEYMLLFAAGREEAESLIRENGDVLSRMFDTKKRAKPVMALFF